MGDLMDNPLRSELVKPKTALDESQCTQRSDDLLVAYLSTKISVLDIPARSGYSNPQLGCNVFVLFLRLMLRLITVFPLTGGLFADTAPSGSLFSNPAARGHTAIGMDKPDRRVELQ